MKRFNLLKEHIEKKDMWLYNNDTEQFYGKCGTPTGLKDKYGDSLFVGDVVKIYDNSGYDNITIVAETMWSGEYSIWGIFNLFSENPNGWTIIKYGCYTKAKHNRTINHLTYMEK